MIRQTERQDAAACSASPELRVQLHELLAAFAEIAQYGREQRTRANDAVWAKGKSG